MHSHRARIRAGIVTGLAAVSLTLLGCNEVSPGEGGGEQQEEQENGEGDD